MYYLFGTLMTHYGPASLNHDKRKGNTSPLQKSKWHNKMHSTVNSDAIRWSLRYYWQQQGYPVNRVWNADEFINTWTDNNYDPERFIDDDVLGYLRAEAARAEVTEEVNEEGSDTEDNEQDQTRHRQRLGALGVNRAFSLTPNDLLRLIGCGIFLYVLAFGAGLVIPYCNQQSRDLIRELISLQDQLKRLEAVNQSLDEHRDSMLFNEDPHYWKILEDLAV